MRDVLYYAQLALESVVGVFGVRLYEEPRFAVVDRPAEGVEVRRYDPRLAAEVEEEGVDDAARNRAFSALFAYIAGGNAGDAGAEKIAMTTPVEVGAGAERIAMTMPVETAGDDGLRTRMRFFLPAARARAAPRPTDPRVRLVELPAETFAVRRFGGRAGAADVARQRARLQDALEGSAWKPAGEPVTLFYDAPFTLPFARRNEVAIPVVPRR